jgi:hypothetical protein
VSRRRAPTGQGRAPAELPPGPLDPAQERQEPSDNPAPTPAPASRRLSSSPPPPRPGDDFFCRQCGYSVTSPEPPTGWFRVQQRDPNPAHYNSRLYGTLALLCSPGCLRTWAVDLDAKQTPAKTP